mgnify:CR=1 FL=1
MAKKASKKAAPKKAAAKEVKQVVTDCTNCLCTQQGISGCGCVCCQ